MRCDPNCQFVIVSVQQSVELEGCLPVQQTVLGQLLQRTQPHHLGLAGFQSESAGLQPDFDVDETRSKTSDG